MSHVRVRAIAEPAGGLELLRQRISNQRDVLALVGIIMRQEFGENFAQQGRPTQWEALKPSTIAQKQDLFNTGQIRGRNPQNQQLVRGGGGSLPGILVRRGDLRNSYVRRGARGNIAEFGGDNRSLEVGSSLPYAGYHESGHEGGKIIEARRGGALRFLSASGPVFRKRVRLGALARRSVLYVSPEGMDRIQQAYVNYLDGNNPGGAAGGD